MSQDRLTAGLAGALLVAGTWLLTEKKVPQRLLRQVLTLLRGEKKRHRRVRDGYTGATDDLSLFYGMDQEALTTVTDEARLLPQELYEQVVRLLPILCVDLAIERPSDGKFLLVKRGAEPAKGFYWPPGGRIFRGETFFAAAVRKAREETGLEAQPLGVLGVYNTFFPTSNWGSGVGTHTVNVCVHMRLVGGGEGGEGAVELDGTCEEHVWVHPREKYHHDPYVQEILTAVASGVCL
jgi:colanic acid biosynthesis protein WcaH